jgi:PiT family inorganic phosphate transporter
MGGRFSGSECFPDFLPHGIAPSGFRLHSPHTESLAQSMARRNAKKPGVISTRERKGLSKIHRVEPVRRLMLFGIAAASIITAPIAGAFASMIFFMLRGMLSS